MRKGLVLELAVVALYGIPALAGFAAAAILTDWWRWAALAAGLAWPVCLAAIGIIRGCD